MNKLSCNLLLVCDQAILGKDSKISLIGIFDQIFVHNLPGHHPKLSLVGIISGEPYTDHILTVIVTDSDGKKLFPDQNIPLNLGLTGKSNLVAEFINLPIARAGQVTFSLLSRQTKLAETTIAITHVAPPAVKNQVVN